MNQEKKYSVESPLPARLTLWQSASHSSMECEVSTTQRFCMVDEMTSHMKRRASGSMPVDGSSSSTSGGSPTSAMATCQPRRSRSGGARQPHCTALHCTALHGMVAPIRSRSEPRLTHTGAHHPLTVVEAVVGATT